MTAFWLLVRRDLTLALRQGSDTAMAVLFAVLVTVLFAFGVGPEPEVLARMAPGLVWVAALLAAMLSLDRLFQSDFDDGSLDLLALGPLPLGGVVLGKCLAHWLTTGLPLIAAAPLLGVLLNLPADGLSTLIVSMLLGTPTLSLIGAVGAALALGARRASVLVAFLVLPLAVPTLIFATAAIDAALSGLPTRPHLSILAALLLATLPLAPWAATAALRQALG